MTTQNRTRTVLTLAAVAIASLVLTSASTNAAVIVTPDHIQNAVVPTGTLIAIDTLYSADPNVADVGWALLSGGSGDDPSGSTNNRFGWEPDGTDDTLNTGGWHQRFLTGVGAQASWTFDLPDGTIIHDVYAKWAHQGNSGSGHEYSYDEGVPTTVPRAAAASLGDLVLEWIAADNDPHNANFENVISGPITVAGGDGFALTFTSAGNFPYSDAVVLDFTTPAAAAAAPEPSSFGIAALGLFGLVGFRRRRVR